MPTKDERRELIVRLIEAESITTQGQLLGALTRAAMPVNQATLSRDLAELGIRKSGGVYVAPPAASDAPDGMDLSAAVRRFVTCGPNLIVMHTAIGQAQPVAVVIDNRGDRSIAGTLAGDDTIFVATRNDKAQAIALRRLRLWFGDKNGR